MPPALSDDIILLIGQNLLSLNSHKTLSSLSFCSKANYQLLTPLVYRHMILTDHSLPVFFSRITDIPQEDKPIFFAKIQEEEEEDIVPSSLHPVRRLRIQLSMIHKITVDTNFEDFDFLILSSIARCLDQFFDGILMPSVSRIVFTAKHGTSRRVGLLSNDCSPHLLRNFLPIACQPKYICCTYSHTTPACLGVTLDPLFSLSDDSQEVVNIHQARRIFPPSGSTTSRISFGPPRCLYGDDRCTRTNHPEACKQEDVQERIKDLLFGDPTTVSCIMTKLPIDDQSSKSDRSPLKIIERADPHNEGNPLPHREYMQRMLNVIRDNPPPPGLVNFLRTFPQGFGIGNPLPGTMPVPVGGQGTPGNMPNPANGGNGGHGDNGNGNGSNNGGVAETGSGSNDVNGNFGNNVNGDGHRHQGNSQNPGETGHSFNFSTMNITVMPGAYDNIPNNPANSNNSHTQGINVSSTTTTNSLPANNNPAVHTGLNGMSGSLGSLFRSTFFGNFNNHNNANAVGGNGSATNQNTNPASTSTHPTPSPLQPDVSDDSRTKEDQVHPDFIFVIGEDIEKEPVCEACGEPI